MSGRTNTTRFRRTRASVSKARRHVEAVLIDWRLGHLVEPAALITSELATNTVLHAHGISEYFELTLRRRRSVLVLEVADACTWARPELRKPDPEALGGRGLWLVDTLADAWGVRERSVAGKTVWVQLATRGGGDA
ncbi:ATP-binding protein [Streptomyces sp. NBC_01471]|uniref:ATP-binding protein n=1 Tax=Streptomyces sp. NBC_01471 TaxID=2903879 RepID=UPI0032432F91